MEIETNTQQPPAETPHPYDAFRAARNHLMLNFLEGLGGLEEQLLRHDRDNRRLLDRAQGERDEALREVVRLQTTLDHRPAAIGWDGIQDLGERPPLDAVQEAGAGDEDSKRRVAELEEELRLERENTSRLAEDLAKEREDSARLEGQLAKEQANTARLERDNRTLEEKIEDDRRQWTAQEESRRGESENLAAEVARELAASEAERARLAGEVSTLGGQLADARKERGEAEKAAEKAKADIEDLQGTNGALSEELDRLKSEPLFKIDVDEVRSMAAAEATLKARDRVAAIILAIEADNAGIRLNDALELFAAAWEAPVVGETAVPAGPAEVTAEAEPPVETEKSAPSADLFDFTLPPPTEDTEIPYVPTVAVAAGS